ncbi:hypothetical protein AB0M54_20550 [Actinoplanes sp. NPDC051470]|uniref:hypothetical protein n=1 Tax=Actinoplanes sp. NPDC051470 TaxID=3157224 RepID=UPI00341335DE
MTSIAGVVVAVTAVTLVSNVGSQAAPAGTFPLSAAAAEEMYGPGPSRVRPAESLAETRQEATFVVVGKPRSSSVTVIPDGLPMAGARVTRVVFQVERSVSGPPAPAKVIVKQLGSTIDPPMYGREFLKKDESYLLYLLPDDLVKGSGDFVIGGDGEYRLMGSTYYNVTVRLDKVPSAISAASLDQVVLR